MSIKTDAVAQPELGIPSKSDSLSEKLASDAPSVAELPELQMPWSCKGLGEDRPLRSSRMYFLSALVCTRRLLELLLLILRGLDTDQLDHNQVSTFLQFSHQL